MQKVVKTLLFVLIFLLSCEVLLQVRAHIRYGESIFDVAQGESLYVLDPKLGIKLLKPSTTVVGSKTTIVTNSYGLRSPEITRKKQPNEIRIAVVGASTVMGGYTRNNKDTLPSRLEYRLQSIFPHHKVTVINGGIAGYYLKDELLILQKLLYSFDLDYIVLYTGFNDVKTYCSENKQKEKGETFSLPRVYAPKWLLTVELITKNTVFLKNIAAGGNDYLNPDSLDTARYRRALNNLLADVHDKKIPMLVVTNARSFRREMPLKEQLRLSETARYYIECLDLDGLHSVYDSHNKIILSLAEEYGFSTFDLMSAFPGGAKNFRDATHFSLEGTDRVSELLTGPIVSDLKQIGF